MHVFNGTSLLVASGKKSNWLTTNEKNGVEGVSYVDSVTCAFVNAGLTRFVQHFIEIKCRVLGRKSLVRQGVCVSCFYDTFWPLYNSYVKSKQSGVFSECAFLVEIVRTA